MSVVLLDYEAALTVKPDRVRFVLAPPPPTSEPRPRQASRGEATTIVEVADDVASEATANGATGEPPAIAEPGAGLGAWQTVSVRQISAAEEIAAQEAQVERANTADGYHGLDDSTRRQRRREDAEDDELGDSPFLTAAVYKGVVLKRSPENALGNEAFHLYPVATGPADTNAGATVSFSLKRRKVGDKKNIRRKDDENIL